jgi:hypothetical protein
LAQGGTVQLTQVGTFSFATPSAGDISPTGREILIRNEDTALLYQRGENQTVAQALAGNPIVAKVIGTPTEANGEAIAFDANGNGYFTISEGSNPRLYYFHRTSQFPGQVGSWHNAQMPNDVNQDGLITALDVLVVVNDLNLNGARTLPNLGTAQAPARLDVNNDGLASPLDVLLIVNHLNQQSTLRAFAASTSATVASSSSPFLPEQPQAQAEQPVQVAALANDEALQSESFAQELGDLAVTRHEAVAATTFSRASRGRTTAGRTVTSDAS